MKLSAIIGYLITIALLYTAIVLGGSLVAFIDIPSMLFLVGLFLAFLLFGKVVDAKNPQAASYLFALMTLSFFAVAIIGDFIGGIQMMGNISDPKAVGPSMAVSLITSLYGLAMMLFVSGPLEDRAAKEQDADTELSLSRITWCLFPIYSIIMGIAILFVMFFSLGPVR
jgi:flagellar motor component MotA